MNTTETPRGERIRVAVAEALGYERWAPPSLPAFAFLIHPSEASPPFKWMRCGPHVPVQFTGAFPVPEWESDHAAGWEMESRVPYESHVDYIRALEDVVGSSHLFRLVHATPEQRCLAFLAVSGVPFDEDEEEG